MTDYTRPTYEVLKTRIEADLAAMPAVLRGPLSAAWARACHSQHGYLEWIDAQCSPLTCELERLYDWAALYGVDRLLPTAATGAVLATGTVGAEVLAGTLLRGLNGLDYVVLAAVTLTAEPTTLTVRCMSAGSAGNQASGLTLSLIDPIPGVSGTLTIDTAGLTGGAEEEALEAWRWRVAAEWRVMVTRGGRGGKVEDYRHWAVSAHPSVTAALVQPHALGIGTVLVRPICDSLADRLPTQAVLDAVAAYLQDISPATADWRVAAPLVRLVDVALHLLPGDDTATTRAAITSALGAAILAESSEASVLGLAEIDAAVASVTTQYTRIAPSAEIAVGAGEVLVLGEVTWS